LHSERTKDLESEIRSVIEAEFPGDSYELVDESAAHYGHAGAMEHGGKHFALKLVSERFQGLSRVKRHQLIYQILDSRFTDKSIHALKLTLLTGNESSTTL